MEKSKERIPLEKIVECEIDTSHLIPQDIDEMTWNLILRLSFDLSTEELQNTTIQMIKDTLQRLEDEGKDTDWFKDRILDC